MLGQLNNHTNAHYAASANHRLLVILFLGSLAGSLIVRSRRSISTALIDWRGWIDCESPRAAIGRLHGLVVTLGARIVFREDVVLAVWAHPVTWSKGLGESSLLILLDDFVHLCNCIIGLLASTLFTVLTESKFVDLADRAPPVSAAQLISRPPFLTGEAPATSVITAGTILEMVEPACIALITFIVLPSVANIGSTRTIPKTSSTSALISVSTSTSTSIVFVHMVKATRCPKLAVTLLVSVANI